ncbi:MAG TPA: FAD-dependent oxidoreductase, partial [Micromonospora sp.]
MHLDCAVLVVGAGCGGTAAALSATRLGHTVILTEPTSRVGGQLTTQAVPPDEHPWVESTGVTASYRRLRDGVREHYRRTRPLTPAAKGAAHLNPGQAWVSGLSAEPVVFHEVLREMLAPAVERGLLRVLTRHRPVAVEVTGDRVDAVTFVDERDGGTVRVTARHVLDASEEGDLLPLAGAEHVLGAESRAQTGEPHALDGPADPADQQGVTWCAALELRPGGDNLVPRPASYPFW